MSITTIRLSNEGQLVITKKIRDGLHWESGTKLELISSTSGITLRSIIQKSKLNLANLRGILQYDGPPISTEELLQAS